MTTHEHTINDAVARVLRETRRTWRDSNVVRSENTGLLKGSSNARPDILVTEPNVSPVVIESEVFPATSVESEATSRLGKQLSATGDMLLSAISLRLPTRLRSKEGNSLHDDLTTADDLDIALYTGTDSSTCSRWPHSGWISGSVYDLSRIVQSASVPPKVVEEAADQLVSGVSEAAGLLQSMARSHYGAVHKISEELCQEDGDQTQRMATTILANAFVFHESLAGGSGELVNISSLEQLRDSSGNLSNADILAEWRKILGINYWPIFDIARRILQVIPTSGSKPLIEVLAKTANRLLQNRLMRSHDLAGAVFQRLIADRKFLAAYYTTPASAALLAGLAITPENVAGGGSWANADDVRNLRIADFSCGTGMLLSTAYQRVSQLHELAGGDAESLHSEMMASALTGCDVLPAAAHLTASMLSGAHPTVKYNQSSVLTVAYGKQESGDVALGSLDLLDPQGKFEILSITARAAEGMGEVEKETWLSLPDSSFDVAIMNPPFTRATGHEGTKIGVPNPIFAAFKSDKEEQQLMGAAMKRLTTGTSAHGNAGEASMFLALADRKLRSQGMLALVMPLSLMSGDAWEDSRALIAKNYSDLVLVSIAGADNEDMSFSADTGMGESLVVGCKSATGSTRATFVVLSERPAFPLLGASVAEQIRRLIAEGHLRRLEEGSTGGTPLYFGDEVIGQAMDAPLPGCGGWNIPRIADLSLAQAAYQLADEDRIWLPTMNQSQATSVPITKVSAIGEVGPYHADINGKTQTGRIRGPFDKFPVKSNSAPTYPILWSHDAQRERTMSFEADSEGLPRQGSTSDEQQTVDRKVSQVWATASHCHFNRDFRFNSQSTGMQFTPRRSIGGRAWLSIRLSFKEQEKALVLWANTSLGVLLHWWYANKQQSGRGSVGKRVLQTLPILDVTQLTQDQLDRAVKLFDSMSEQQLLPLHEIDKDPVRKELDERFAIEILDLDESIVAEGGALELLRMKLAREPSIRGGK